MASASQSFEGSPRPRQISQDFIESNCLTISANIFTIPTIIVSNAKPTGCMIGMTECIVVTKGDLVDSRTLMPSELPLARSWI
jgi:hypothetical protein